ncbi:hypothetical protein B0H16DRAFT_1796874 [Mycena metata]|uniref:Uncharacterized protein n=1 Tax=Mycena metata TaxID=1033252 RepID=A0AAD7HEH6_9AGAR|nr:hypothetical protein B0H16DRAFT_1796874 [Mycena metata]
MVLFGVRPFEGEETIRAFFDAFTKLLQGYHVHNNPLRHLNGPAPEYTYLPTTLPGDGRAGHSQMALTSVISRVYHCYFDGPVKSVSFRLQDMAEVAEPPYLCKYMLLWGHGEHQESIERRDLPKSAVVLFVRRGLQIQSPGTGVTYQREDIELRPFLTSLNFDPDARGHQISSWFNILSSLGQSWPKIDDPQFCFFVLAAEPPSLVRVRHSRPGNPLVGPVVGELQHNLHVHQRDLTEPNQDNQCTSNLGSRSLRGSAPNSTPFVLSMDDLEFLFADEPPLEPDDSENHLGNEPDLPDIPGGADTIREPIHRRNSRYLRDKLSADELVQKVKTVLACMRTEGLNLPIFLDAVCWGDPKCIADATVRYARTALMTSEELPGILERCYNPPRPAGE